MWQELSRGLWVIDIQELIESLVLLWMCGRALGVRGAGAGRPHMGGSLLCFSEGTACHGSLEWRGGTKKDIVTCCPQLLLWATVIDL